MFRSKHRKGTRQRRETIPFLFFLSVLFEISEVNTSIHTFVEPSTIWNGYFVGSAVAFHTLSGAKFTVIYSLDERKGTRQRRETIPFLFLHFYLG